MKENFLGNVVMDTCVVCQKEYQLLMQSKGKEDIFKGKKSVCSGWMCDECEKMVSENVSLLCDTCGGIMIVKPEALEGTKAWDKYRIYKCQECNKDAWWGITFLPPDNI